ncbi:hypothetical protein [Candidatus Pelagibacter sp. HIMB1321]|uniref:hypothetical protein n=1 Tax=Candidatus Pelagibacter sp. HIMB1321 TaxID=1388755 RepID=UPI000A07F24C|nr:hypothetical protein [Candidatus Pelagibacter sp. HIMB1321]SMF72096.1 hypothetical protein SAMN02744631_0200 [Candidatus Pelagibacter sp. HIMB1321]
MTNKVNISEKVIKVQQLIEKEEKIKILENWYENIKNHIGISDYEKEYLVSAVEKRIRVKFPNKARKVLGGKSAKAQELLEEIYQSLIKEFDWSQNNVGNKVKVCGSMISGKEFVCWYISYKNNDGYSTGLHFRQKKAEDDPYLDVDYRKVGNEYEKDREVKTFPVQFKDEAINLFRDYLRKVIK